MTTKNPRVTTSKLFKLVLALEAEPATLGPMKKSPAKKAPRGKEKSLDFDALNKITERAFFMALQMIDHANHKRPSPGKGEPKVGGHPSACASSQHILAAIHLVSRKPEDYFACKPHVSPMDHAFNFLLDSFFEADGTVMPDERKKIAMRNLRHFSKSEPVFQSYHAEADPDAWRYFPSGSVGIPPVNALYMSLAYDFAKDHGNKIDEDPMFWCLMGDSEYREGSLAEAMPDAGERELKNLVWIVDYNRQNLDGTRIFNEEAFGGTDADRIAAIGAANGWHAVILKHGKKRQRLFETSGGDEFQRVFDEELTDFEFQALLGTNDAKRVRQAFLDKSSKLKGFLGKLSDEDLMEAFFNVAGHDLESLVETFEAAKESNKPTLVVAYTIKGRGLRCAALSGNHSALPEEDELEAMAKKLGLSTESPFEDFSDDSAEGQYLAQRRVEIRDGIRDLRAKVKERQATWLEHARNEIEWPAEMEISALKFNPVAHTQWMWGQIAAKLDRLGRGGSQTKEGAATDNDKQWGQVARYFLTMAPDVGSSTNTSPNMNGKLYGDTNQPDFEKTYGVKDDKAPDVMPSISEKSGHIRFEIAEGNCMSAAGSFGKFFHFVGVPLFPAMTIYDFFIKRALDQLYYNVYWHSSFATLGTPSGVTLAPEGAQHSWKSDIQMPHAVTWEPCYAKELEWIFADMLRRHFTREDKDREGIIIRCVTKGLVQKEFHDRLKTQLRFENLSDAEIMESTRVDALAGGYALVDYRGTDGYVPGDNVVHLFAMGALVPEALKASDLLKERGIYANVFVVTSPDLLLGGFAHENRYEHLKTGLGINGNLHLPPTKRLEGEAGWYSVQGARIPIVSVHDGEAGLLDNIGSIVGVKHLALAVRKTSKSGTTPDIFHFQEIDSEAVIKAVEEVMVATAEERFEVASEVFQRETGQAG